MNWKPAIVLAIAACAAAATAPRSETVTIKTVDGKGADATVDSGRKDEKLGRDKSLRVKFSTAAQRKAYIRFDLSLLKGRKAKAARLTLEIDTENTGLIRDWTYNVIGLREAASYGQGKLGEDWDETEITYANAPGNDPKSGGGEVDEKSGKYGGVLKDYAIPLGTFKIAAGKRDRYGFTSQALADFVNADTNKMITLVITRVDNHTDVIGFAGKEGGKYQPPTLEMTIEPDSSKPAAKAPPSRPAKPPVN